MAETIGATTISLPSSHVAMLSHSQEVADFILRAAKGPVILVGHSYGGVIISNAGTGPKVAGLVYIAAFAPDIGESAAQFLPKGPLPDTPTKNGVLFMERPIYLGAFAPDVPQDVKEFMADSQVPIQLSGVTAKATTAAWKIKPTWYLVSEDDAVGVRKSPKNEPAMCDPRLMGIWLRCG